MSELRGIEAMGYLKEQMKLMDETYRHCGFPCRNIEYELKKYKSSDDIISDVL